MKKIYKLTYAEHFDMEVEIDHDVMTEAKFHEINNFWGGAATRVMIARTVQGAVLRFLCTTFMDESVQRIDPMGSFQRGEVEGWPPLDGSCGIKLLRFDTFSFDDAHVDIEEMTA